MNRSERIEAASSAFAALVHGAVAVALTHYFGYLGLIFAVFHTGWLGVLVIARAIRRMGA